MKVLFVDTVHPILEERLNNLGYTCHHDLKGSKEEIEAKIHNYTGLVIRSRFTLDEQFFDQAKSLKFVARSGAGLENINLSYAEKKDVRIFNSPEGNKDAVGEHAVGMLLMLFNQLKKGDLEVRQAIWDREGNRGLEIAGKTVGIVGYGNMGSAFAKKLAGFDCKVVAFDKYKTGFGDEYVDEVSLDELRKDADILSLHVPLAEDTKYLVDEEFIQKMDKKFYIINTARGQNIEIKALVNGIKSGKVLGACLDVLEYETKSFETISSNQLPADFEYLTNSQNVVLSPHVAGWSVESYIKLSTYLADKIEQHFHTKVS